MVAEALVKRAKEIVALGRSGKTDEAYAEYKKLFESAEFLTFPIDDRRQCIKLVVNARIPPTRPAAGLVEAHRAAIKPLEDAIGAEAKPIDFELLGICFVFVGDEKKAADAFRTGLRIERENAPGSDLCGSLMKWVAAV